MIDGLGETAHGVFGGALSVGFEGVLECIGHVAGFAEIGALDCSRLGVVVRPRHNGGERGGREGENYLLVGHSCFSSGLL